MPITVLVVDDSAFFRRQIKKLLAEDDGLEVIETAENGKDAVEKALRLKPDVITMDIEMPVMNGIDATKEIMRQRKIPILMFSSLTTDGAQATLDAMEAGAIDFIPKRFEDISRNPDEVSKLLCNKVRAVGSHGRVRIQHEKKATTTASSVPSRKIELAPEKSSTDYKLLAIGTSTGGPLALQEVLKNIPKNFPVPILLIQHMPATFTPAFANRLDQQCQIGISEAVNGETLKAGHAYLAPGGKQMKLVKRGTQLAVDVQEGDTSLTYRPSVDITFSSIASVVPSNTLAIILTGMGADGCKGAKQLKNGGSAVWAQDEASSVVWGMPAAVVEEKIAEKVLPLKDIGNQIMKSIK